MNNKVKKIYEMTENEINEFMNKHLPLKLLDNISKLHSLNILN